MDRLNALTIALQEGVDMSGETAKMMLNSIFNTPGVEVDPITNAMYVESTEAEDEILHIIREGGFRVMNNFPLRYVEVPYQQGVSGIPYKDGITMAIILTPANMSEHDTWILSIDPDNIAPVDESGF